MAPNGIDKACFDIYFTKDVVERNPFKGLDGLFDVPKKEPEPYI
jgi:hypothetical protein